MVGGGAAGLTAALALAAAGVEALVLERDPVPRGSTALSAGLIPAAGTRFQRERGVSDDTAERFAADIQAKAHGRASPEVVRAVAEGAAPAVEWLADAHGLAFSLVHDFDYPGHARRRMHGLPSRSGADLVDALRAAAERAGVAILTDARATTLVADRATGAPLGLVAARPDGAEERIGCRALVLACSGYGADRALVAEHLPAMRDALYFGHPGNEGHAARWGAALGARLADMSGHQGHGSVAHPLGSLVTWAVLTSGGVQVDATGARFHDESRGYSEAAAAVLARPGGVAWCVYDERIAEVARQFADYRGAEEAGAVLRAEGVEALAAAMRVPARSLAATLDSASAARRGDAPDPLGRDFAGLPDLAPPYRAVRVTGALFHTQGGLDVDARARVLRAADGSPVPGLYAAGGAARGVSGPDPSGYLSGNGLLTAVVLGRLAGEGAAAPLAGGGG